MKIKTQEIAIMCLQILRLGPRSNHYNIRPFCKAKYKNNEIRIRSVLRIHEDKVRKTPEECTNIEKHASASEEATIAV